MTPDSTYTTSVDLTLCIFVVAFDLELVEAVVLKPVLSCFSKIECQVLKHVLKSVMNWVL